MGPPNLLVSTIALTHEAVGPPPGFSPDSLRSLLRPPLHLYPAGDGLRVLSARDQLEVVLSAPKTELSDLSGSVQNGSVKFSTYLDELWQLLGSPGLLTYEIGFVLEAYGGEQEDIAQWLGQRFLRSGLQGDEADSVSSLVVSFSYARGAKWQDVEMQVDTPSRLLIRYTASESVSAVPEPGLVLTEVNSEHDNLVDFLKRVGFE